ncbi:o-succinylbenzoate--CoA ligase [Archangium primigenium]|uniref:o-succinylbenzoate--CoA ligase n=1 Tax=[Archangium] primigenium TaxID=2792470 RepID=UPI00195B6735|nr:o-succinylbenzoate--CoA ligase [Archangium primigenium]MBM7116754.1 o-succinylbenzoate--CoA ligase [Archangium primigenium]
MTEACPIREGAGAHPDALALTFAGQGWTYAALDEAVGRWVAALRARGVGKGECVGVLSTNHAALVHLFFALGRVGAVLAPFNARLTPSELGPMVEDVAPRLLLALSPFVSLLPGAEPLESFADTVARASPDCPPLESGAARVILFTSGTTGRPKGAVLTEGNFRASARGSRANLGAHPAPRWLGTLPLFHVGGLAMLTRTAYDGGCLVLRERFDADDTNRALDTEGITHASFVATTLERILDARQDAPVPASFQCALIGGGPVPAPLLARARAAGIVSLQTYGLTESCSQAATERPDEADGLTAGRALPGLEVRVVGPSGEPLAPGEEGELEVRGPTVMAGYWNRPEATREVLREEGWLRTRDLGRLDARGRLTVLARRTDLILRGGENVYPAEVEKVLADHPSVREAAVVGVPHARWGEVPVAFVVPRDGAPLAADVLEAWCQERLARFKLPTRLLPLDALPRNAMGKVERGALRQRALAPGLTPTP